MPASLANRQNPFRSLPNLGSFESGGSCSSRSPAGFTTPRSFNGGVNADLTQSFTSNGSHTEATSQVPAAVAVTVLQPVVPEEEGRELIGTLSDQADQVVKITAWPALRVPFKIHHGTVLTLRIFRAATGSGRSLFSSLSDATPDAGSFVAGIRVPVGLLMSRGGSKQSWCALDGNLGATAACTSALETFEVLRKRAACEICPKAFISLRALRADEMVAKASSPHRTTSPTAMVSPPSSILSPRPLATLSDSFSSSRFLAQPPQEADVTQKSLRIGSLRDLLHDAEERIESRGDSRLLQDYRPSRNDSVERDPGWQAERRRLMDEIYSLQDSLANHESRAASFELQVQQSSEALAAAARATRGHSNDLEASEAALAATERERVEAAASAEALKNELALAREIQENAMTEALAEARSEAIVAKAIAKEAQTKMAELAEANLREASADRLNEESRLQKLVDEVDSLNAALREQESLVRSESETALVEAKAANARKGDVDQMAEELSNSEALLCTVESRLASLAIPEAQHLLDSLLQQEQHHECSCRELSEIREQQASDGFRREEIEGYRGQLLSNIECRVQTLQEEIDKEREHFSYHDGHGMALEAQFEELRGYTESRDKELAVSRAELGRARYELQEQRECTVSPNVEALRSELGMLESRLGQEQGLFESRTEQFHELQLESKDIEDQSKENFGLTSFGVARPQSPSGLSMRPALRHSKLEVGEAPDRRRDPARTVCFQEESVPTIGAGIESSSSPGADENGQDVAEEALEPSSLPTITVTDVSGGNSLKPSLAIKAEPEAEETIDLDMKTTQETPGVLQIRIDRSHDQTMPLGIDLNFETLEITSIADKGLMKEWNTSNPTKEVCCGDSFLEVNGARTANDILATIKDKSLLNISVQKKAVSDALHDSGSQRRPEPPKETTRQKPRVDASVGKIPRRSSTGSSNPPSSKAVSDRLHRGETSSQRRRSTGQGMDKLMSSPQKQGSLADSPSSSLSAISDRPSPSPMKDSRVPTRKAASKFVGTPEKKQHADFMSSLRR